MKVEVESPRISFGSVIGDFLPARSEFEASPSNNGNLKVQTKVPLGEMFGYCHFSFDP